MEAAPITPRGLDRWLHVSLGWILVGWGTSVADVIFRVIRRIRAQPLDSRNFHPRPGSRIGNQVPRSLAFV